MRVHSFFAISIALQALLFQAGSSNAELPPIKVGATLALSGKLSFTGTAEREGFEMAAEDINANGGIDGRKLELVIDDNTGDPKTALNSVNKLFDADKIDFLFSAFTHVTQGIKDRAKRAGKVMIYHAAMGAIAAESELFFRDWGDAEEESLAIIHAVAKAGYKRAAFLAETNDACVAFQKLLEREAPRLGVELVATEIYTAGETDLKPILLRLSQRTPEALITCTWRDGALLMSQLSSLNLLSLPTFQTLAPLVPVNDTPEVRKLYEQNKSVSVWFGFVESELTDEQKKMYARFRTRAGIAPRAEALIAYDDLMALARAAKGCVTSDSVDQPCVAKHLADMTYKGVAGELCFRQRLSNRPSLLIRVENGIWKKISEEGGSCSTNANSEK